MKPHTMQLSIYLTVCLVLAAITGHSQSCDTELKVYKDRDSRSISPDDGTTFRLTLSNNLNRAQTYSLEVNSGDNECRDGQTVKTSEVLDAKMRTNQGQIESVIVPAASAKDFFVSVSRGSAKSVNSWYCVDLTISSETCGQQISKKLNVYLSDGKDY
jgi:uncharacterized membrane protein